MRWPRATGLPAHDGIGKQFVMGRARQFQLDLLAAGRCRAGTIRPSRRASGPTVQPCTTSETSTMMKAMLKISAAVLEPAEQRRDGEQDRHRAAQADPGDEGGLRRAGS